MFGGMVGVREAAVVACGRCVLGTLADVVGQGSRHVGRCSAAGVERDGNAIGPAFAMAAKAGRESDAVWAPWGRGGDVEVVNVGQQAERAGIGSGRALGYHEARGVRRRVRLCVGSGAQGIVKSASCPASAGCRAHSSCRNGERRDGNCRTAGCRGCRRSRSRWSCRGVRRRRCRAHGGGAAPSPGPRGGQGVASSATIPERIARLDNERLARTRTIGIAEVVDGGRSRVASGGLVRWR